MICELIEGVFHCMFGGRNVSVNAVRMESYRTQLTKRIAVATREMEAAQRFRDDRTLNRGERREQAILAKKKAAFINAAHKKLALLESTNSAIDRMRDDHEFVVTMKQAGLKKVTERLEKDEDELKNIDNIIADLEDFMVDVPIDESELEMELEMDMEQRSEQQNQTLPLIFPEVPTRGSRAGDAVATPRRARPLHA